MYFLRGAAVRNTDLGRHSLFSSPNPDKNMLPQSSRRFSAPNVYLFSADTNPFIPFRRIIPRLTIESFLLFSARRNNIGTPRSCILYFAILLVLKNIHPTFYRYVQSSYQLWAATPLRRTSFIKRVTLQTSRANVLRIQHQQDSPSIQISVCSSIQHERLFIKACSGPATEGTHSGDNA